MRRMKNRIGSALIVLLLAAAMMASTVYAAPKAEKTKNQKTETQITETQPAETQVTETQPAETQPTETPTTEAPKKVAAQRVAKVTCTAAGKLNVSFKNKVTYLEGVSAKVTDADGQELACKISKKNKALMSISVAGMVKGQKYTVVIEGVKAQNAEEAAVITKEFTAKGMKTELKPASVKMSTKKVFIIKLKSAGYYKDATVQVVDENGQELAAKIVKKAKGNIKVQAEGIEKGKKYTVTITGVKTKKEKNFSSITKTFTAK